MKRIFNKIVIITLIIISLVSFIFSNYSYAVTTEEVINTVTNLAGGIVSILHWDKRIQVTGIAFVASTIATGIAKLDGTISTIDFLTPYDIFFNKARILDINFFEIDGLDTDSATYKIRVNVSKWYYLMRLIALSILLIVLLYVGIRMAFSSIAEEQAKYKKMLFDWVCSLVLLFILHYIAIFTIYANSTILRALENIVKGTDLEDLVMNIGLKAVFGIGIESITSVIVYALIVVATIGFLIGYMNRMLKVGFLLLVSPLITITYSIDKMGDGKSQAVNNWLKEFVYTILIQPFHCIIYITFVSIAFELMNSPNPLYAVVSSEYNQLTNAILAVLCLKFITDAEKIVRKIFGFADNNKGTGLAAGLAVASVGLAKTQNAGKSARNLVNKAKDNKFLKAVSKDVKGSKLFGKAKDKIGDMKDKFQNSSLGKGLDSMKGKANDLKKKIGKSKVIKGFKKGMEAKKRFMNTKPMQWLKGRNSLPSALGIAAGLATYGTGGSALSALGVANKTQEASEQFFSSSAKTIGEDNAELMEKRNENLSEELPELQEESENLQRDLEDASNDLGMTTQEAEEEIAKDKEDLAEMEEQYEERKSLDEQIQESSDRMQEYRSVGSFDQMAAERAHRSELIQQASKFESASVLEKQISASKQSIEGKESKLKRVYNLQEQIDEVQYQIETIQSELSGVKSKEAMRAAQDRIMQRGDAGAFKATSKELDEIVRNIDSIMERMGLSEQSAVLQRNLQRELTLSPNNFDLDDMLKRTLGTAINHPEISELRKAARRFETFKYDAKMYENLKFSTGMNVTEDRIAQKTFDSMRENRKEHLLEQIENIKKKENE